MNEFGYIDSTTTMDIANAAIINENLKIKDCFVDALKNYYEAMTDVSNFNKITL